MPADRPATLAPLRKIVDHSTNSHGTQIDVLECGHELHLRYDIYGATNAVRRRCRKCLAVAQESESNAA